MITGIPQQPSGHSPNETFCKEISDSKQKIKKKCMNQHLVKQEYTKDHWDGLRDIGVP
jgi:hypothetical protein